jgi:hypothetical protein
MMVILLNLGWAFGVNLKSGHDGVFPMGIVDSRGSKRFSTSSSSRAKSLLHSQSPGKSKQNRVHVTESYLASMDDEMDVHRGDFIVVHEQYDDGTLF